MEDNQANAQNKNNMNVATEGNPATQPYVLDKRKVGCAVVVVIIAAIALFLFFGHSNPRSDYNFETYAISLVKNQYNESAKVLCSGAKVVEKDGKGRALVTMKVEVQRVFADLEVTEYASVILYLKEDGEGCTYNSASAVSIEDTEADRSKILNIQKSMCNWGEDYSSGGY